MYNSKEEDMVIIHNDKILGHKIFAEDLVARYLNKEFKLQAIEGIKDEWICSYRKIFIHKDAYQPVVPCNNDEVYLEHVKTNFSDFQIDHEKQVLIMFSNK
jgi:hypothetical protein